MILGALETELQVALVAAGGAAATAALAALPQLLQRKATKQVSDAVGRPNGHGSMIEMLTKLLSKIDRQDERIVHIDKRLGELERAVVRIAARTDD